MKKKTGKINQKAIQYKGKGLEWQSREGTACISSAMPPNSADLQPTINDLFIFLLYNIDILHSQ